MFNFALGLRKPSEIGIQWNIQTFIYADDINLLNENFNTLKIK
jgi:hypothetical protein